MKKFATIFTLALFTSLGAFAQVPDATGAGSVPAAPATPALPLTTVDFSETVYNFGTIEQGTPVTHKFTVTNSGKEDLVINEVKRTCGCTGLEWSREAIKPGESGWVEATFNAANPGPFTKTIFFNANIDPNPVGLTFQGEVKKKEEMNLSGGTMMDAHPVAPTQNAVEHNHPH